MTAQQQQKNNEREIVAFLLTVAIVATLAAILVAGAYAASYLTSLSSPGITARQILAGFGDMVTGEPPSEAFPEPAATRLPGARILWGFVLAVAIVPSLFVAKIFLWASNRGKGLEKRKRLGVNAQAHFGDRKDKKALHLPEPSPGRFAYAKDGRRNVLATEQHGFDGKRRTVPGALALIGPSRSGKSLTSIIGIQLWQGSAIVSSVKTDLVGPTLEARKAKGEVAFYDPSNVTPFPSNHWSPLRDANDLVGAQRAAKRLLSAVQLDQSGHGTFWSRHGETLLGGLMWLAANTKGLSMTDVARWVLEMDQPTAEDPGKVAVYLRALATDEGIDPERIADVQSTLAGVWRAEGRVSSSYYTSARHAVMPWTREEVRRISEITDITLEWLMSGNNTLYLTAPLMDQDLLAPAFGGVIADLVDSVILRHEQNRPLDNSLLLLLDETANVPLVQLTHWASTIAGYNVQLVTVWQSKGQIDAAYGTNADTVIGNHRTRVFFPGISDLATIRYVSELLGNEHQPGYVNASYNFADIGQSDRDSATGVPLVPGNVLRELADDERLIITGNLPPLHAKALTEVPRRWQHHTRPIES